LASKVLVKGKGKARPSASDRAKLHYTGWTKDGRMFDSSVTRGVPLEIGMGEAIPGWREALSSMVEGERRRVWVPAALGYASRPGQDALRGDLVFDLELVEILHVPKPPPVPKDVAAPPKNAIRSSSGLAYRVLKRGNGKTRPQPSDSVALHFTGWTPDGTVFDSSVMRGKPAMISLQHTIAGWIEGLQLMAVGDRYRFWVPAELAYGNEGTGPTAPAGPLVFDIELVAIHAPGHHEHDGHGH
jgi:peptidylprolyl isomerase